MTTSLKHTHGIEAPPYDPEAALALLKALSETDEYGTAKDQKETLRLLRTAIDRSRPGQRSIFGEGINPMPVPDTDVPGTDA